MSFQLVSSSSLFILFLFIFFLSFFFWPIIFFAQALVPTYVLYLNIIYFYSARLAFQLFWVNVTFFCINILCVQIKFNFSIW